VPGSAQARRNAPRMPADARRKAQFFQGPRTCTPSCSTPPTQHASGQRVNRLQPQGLEPWRAQPGRHDHAQIQQHRRGGGHRKTPPGIEHTGGQRHQRHEGDVGKHPARHDDRDLKAARVPLQPAGHRPHQGRCSGHADDAGDQQSPGQDGGGPVNQNFGGDIAVLGFGCGQHRHKSLAEGAFGKKTAKQVGNAKRHVESVRQGAGAEG